MVPTVPHGYSPQTCPHVGITAGGRENGPVVTYLETMAKAISGRWIGDACASWVGFAPMVANTHERSVDPLKGDPFDAFVLEFAPTATSAGVVDAITVQNAITGDVIPAPAQAPGYYVGRFITDVRSRDST